MEAVVFICLMSFIRCVLCDVSGNVALLGQGNANEGAVLIRGSKGEEFKFIEVSWSREWTFMNAQVVCRQVANSHAAFHKTIELYELFYVALAGISYDCEGNERSLDQCPKKYTSLRTQSREFEVPVSVAGVLCYDVATSISQFPRLKWREKLLWVAKEPESPEWRLLCTESGSPLRHIGCQQTGHLVVDQYDSSDPVADLMLANEGEPCTELKLQLCNTTLHYVKNARCSHYGLESVICRSRRGYRLLGHLVNICEKDLCQYKDLDPSDLESCSCDPSCEFYENCCFDYVTECLHGFNSSTVLYYFGYNWRVKCASKGTNQKPPGEISKDQLRCLAVSGSKKQFWLVAKCAIDWVDTQNIKQNCETEWNKTSAFDALIPYADIENNVHYKNIFCAQCNGFSYDQGVHSNLLPWLIGDVRQDHSNYFPPSTSSPRSCTTAVSSCPPGYSDVRLVKACLEYISVVQYDGVLYRNEHCAKCHGNRYPILEERCPCNLEERCPPVDKIHFGGVNGPGQRYQRANQYLHLPLPPCAIGFHVENSICVPDLGPDYEARQHEHRLNCTSIRDILLIEWHSDFLWSHSPPTTCFYKDRRPSFPLYALSSDWFFTYLSKYNFLTSVHARTTWYTGIFTFDLLNRSLAMVFDSWIDRCKVISTSIEQVCLVGTKSSYYECPGELIEDTGNTGVIVLSNETYVFHNGSFYLLHFVKDSFRLSLSDIGEQSWTHVKVLCVEWKRRYFEAPCRTVPIPKSSYELVSVDGNLLARYRGLTLQPNAYILTSNGDLAMCETPVFFMLTNSQVITGRILYTTSLIALLLTFITYCFFPSLRNLPGLCIMSLAMILIVVTVMMEFVNSLVMDIPWLCKTVAVLSHYLWLVAFCLRTVLAWNLACTFALPPSFQRLRTYDRRFSRVVLVGFGLPALVVLPCLFIDLYQDTGLPLWYGPGPSSCWINDAWASLVVLHVPMFISLTLNAVFFTMTGVGIHRSRRDAEIATSDGTRTDLKHKFSAMLTYIKISSVMGFTLIVAYIVYLSGVTALWYVYIILDSFEGVLIFIFFGCSAQSRKLWREKFSRVNCG